MKKLISILLFFCANAFAGDSLVAGPSRFAEYALPATLQGGPWRVEFQLHDWTLPGSNAQLFTMPALGLHVFIQPDGRLQSANFNVTTIPPGGVCLNQLPASGTQNVLVRVQLFLTPNPAFFCEMWRYDATAYNTANQQLSAISTPGTTGGDVSGAAISDIGFLRVFTTTIPIGSKPPTTADHGDFLELPFDSSTCSSTVCNDISGNGRNATFTIGNYSDVATPNQVAIAFPKTKNAPSWASWYPLNTNGGDRSRLDSSASYSLADTSSAITPTWSQISGGTTATITSTGSTQPFIGNLAFGSYVFNLHVVDVNSSTADAQLPLGAVNYDAKGIVHYPNGDNSQQAKALGPQICLGCNPWAYEDQMNQYAVHQYAPVSACSDCAGYFDAHYDKTWETLNTSGTIQYPYSGTGPIGYVCTSLTSDITPTTMAIPIADKSCLDLASLPTTPVWVQIGTDLGTSSHWELIRVCSLTPGSGNSGTLNVCWDGRGLSGNYGNFITGFPTPGAANTWLMSTAKVGQFKITGSGTLFATDATRALVPGGAPGPPGTVIQTTVVSVSGTAINWVSGPVFTADMVAGWVKLVGAAHSGTPGQTWREVNTFNSPTSMTADHAWPSDLDAGNYSAVITSAKQWWMLQGSYTDGHVFNMLFQGLGCESETACYSVSSHDTPALNNSPQPYMGIGTLKYSYKVDLWYRANSNTTVCYYGSCDLTPLLYYYRSGDPAAKALSDETNPIITRDPEMADGLAGTATQSLIVGGLVISTNTCLAIGACPSLIQQQLNGADIWSQVEGWAVQGEFGPGNCNADDTRDLGYQATWLTQAANWTTSSNKASFVTALNGDMTRDLVDCQRTLAGGYNANEVGSFANGFNFNLTIPVTVTNLSVAMGGTNFTNGAYAQFSGTTTNGSPTIAVGDTYGLFAGQTVSDTNVSPAIPSGSTILSVVTNTSITINHNASAGVTHTLANDRQVGTCYGMDEGTLTPVIGSDTFTINTVTTHGGVMTAQLDTPGNWGKSPILIWFKDSAGATHTYEYIFTGTSGHISGIYNGTVSGAPFAFMTTGSGQPDGGTGIGGLGAIWTDNNDNPTSNHALGDSWACRTTSTTTANLFKAWPYPTSGVGVAYYLHYDNIQAWGQQPFMVGIKSLQMNFAKYNSNSATVAGYASISANTGNWFRNQGWDQTNTKGIAYDTLATACAQITDVAAGNFASIHSFEGCGPLNPSAASTARDNSPEGGMAMILYYLSNPTPTRRAEVDTYYGAQWGATGTCDPSVLSTCDGITTDVCVAGFLSGPKWAGFCFGVAGYFSSAWPAIRQMFANGTSGSGPVSAFGNVTMAKRVYPNANELQAYNQQVFMPHLDTKEKKSKHWWSNLLRTPDFAASFN